MDTMRCIQALCVLFISEISFVTTKYAEVKVSDTSTTSLTSDNTSICTNDKCIMKCCDFGKFIDKVIFEGKDGRLRRKTICSNFNETDTTDFDNVFIDKPNMLSFEIKPDMFTANKSFRFKSLDVTEFGFNVYLKKHAEVWLEIPNAYDRWIRIPNNLYCIDSIILPDEHNASHKTLKPGVWTTYIDIPEEINRPITIVMTVGMLISCFFLLVVLIVYAVLPELRNLCGKILMAYVGSLFIAFLLLAVMRKKTHDASVCEGLTYVIYFFFLASFCWMNVMSYDIWWTFRGYAKARPIHRRGERFKFLMYCLYAFGVPLTMTIMLATLNNVNLTHVPWFVTPKIPDGSCFIKEGEKLLYLYMPMLVLILCNWTFYMMTAVNIWRLSRGTGMLESGAAGSTQARHLNRRRFIIYLKLSVVMGLNWVLELLSYYSADSVIWYISDSYNMLIGVSIFVIFVCKRKILKKLRHRFAPNKKSKWSPTQEDASRTATTTENSTTTTMQDVNTVPLMCYGIREQDSK